MCVHCWHVCVLLSCVHIMQPLVSKEEFERTKKIVSQFGQTGGVGEKLQKKLLERAEAKESWVYNALKVVDMLLWTHVQMGGRGG